MALVFDFDISRPSSMQAWFTIASVQIATSWALSLCVQTIAMSSAYTNMETPVILASASLLRMVLYRNAITALNWTRSPSGYGHLLQLSEVSSVGRSCGLFIIAVRIHILLHPTRTTARTCNVLFSIPLIEKCFYNEMLQQSKLNPCVAYLLKDRVSRSWRHHLCTASTTTWQSWYRHLVSTALITAPIHLLVIRDFRDNTTAARRPTNRKFSQFSSHIATEAQRNA
jgi:hypothetical protein